MQKTPFSACLRLALFGLVILAISGCATRPTPTSTPVPTSTPLPTSTPTPVPTNTLLPTSTPVPVPTNTLPPTSTPSVLRSERSLGEQKTIVLLARLPDVEPQITQDTARQKVFTKLDNYIRQVSYDQTWLEGEVRGWYTLDNKVSYYSISSRNFEVDRDKVMLLVQEVINKADGDVDFSNYPNVLIILGAPKDAYGMMGYCAYPGMLGWADTSPFASESGEVISHGVAVYCENAHVGVLAHDLIHILGGVVGDRRVVPCLYDHTLQGQPGEFRGHYQFYLISMGFWDPMSCHFYKLNLPPPGLSSWTKLRLNWIVPSKIAVVNPGETTTVLLGPLADETSDTLVIKIPLSPTTYYLIENRQSIGLDENLPGIGVLILYADDTVAECLGGQVPVKIIDADPSVPQLEGAAFDIGEGKRDTFIDEEHNITIKLLGKVDRSYEILITTTQG
jgi:M6 family metalloprotease-like protein